MCGSLDRVSTNWIVGKCPKLLVYLKEEFMEPMPMMISTLEQETRTNEEKVVIG